MAKENVSPTQKALNLWAIILIIWAIYRAKLPPLPEVFDEFIAKPLVFILPVWYYITKVEKRGFFEGVDLRFKNWKSDLTLGLAIGGTFFLSALFANFVGGTGLGGFEMSVLGIITIIALALATSISEEILSRGFVLKRLYEESKNIYMSSFISSILFFFLHVPMLFTNPRISGNMLLIFMLTDMVLSLTNSFIFLSRRSLLLPILIHAFYNLAIIFFL